MKRSFLLWIAGVLLIGLVVQMPPSAQAKMDLRVEDQAHEWGDFESPFSLPSATSFTGFFGRLGVYGDVDVLAFDFDDSSEAWSMDMAVPQCGVHFEPFMPSMALIGPGLDAPDDGMLPFQIPEDLGALVFTQETSQEPRPISEYTLFEYNYYLNTLIYPDIPQAGRYYVAIWEPNGHIGAYALQTGNEHPDIPANRMDDIEAAYERIENGEWLGVNCDEPAIVDNCPVTAGQTVVNLPTVEESRPVGEGYSLTGIVRDAETCLPIANAQIFAELTDEGDETVAVYQALFQSNQQGGYRFDSYRPVSNEALIYLAVVADGYVGVATTYLVEDDADWGELSINLLPE